MTLDLLRERADRHLTASLERGEKCALGANLKRRLRVVQRREQRAHPLVIVADLHGDRPLAGSREPLRRVEIRGNALRYTEAVNAGGGENRCVHLAVVYLSNSRRHIAA